MTFSAAVWICDGRGRGGIRTHGGFPHARFRVECLKPDSATLPRCRIVDRNSRVVGLAFQDYSHLIHNLNRFTAMIQLKRGIPPASLSQPRTSANRQKNKPVKRTNTGLQLERVFSDASIAPLNQIAWEQ